MSDVGNALQQAQRRPIARAKAPPEALAKALLAAQKEMPAVEPDGVNPHFRSRFVTLGKLLAKAKPVLNKHGICVSQLPSRAEDGSPTLTTILMHESGEELREVAPLLLAKNDPQGQGSAITYMKRYALASALGISDQEDDDGNAGSAEPPKPVSRRESLPASPEILSAIRTALKDRKVGQVKLLLVASGVEDTSDPHAAVDSLSQAEAEALVSAIEQADQA